MSHKLIKSIMLSGLGCSVFINSSAVVAEDLPTVVVSAARTQQSVVTVPAAIHVISREQIEASGASSLSDVLRGQPGIYLSDLHGDGVSASVSMRGFGSEGAKSNVLIIIDGRRINTIDLKGPNLNSISIKDIERVEIVQGSAGTLYGDQAVAGVINVITRKSEKFGVEVEAFTGSYDRNRVMARVENKKDNGLSYVVATDFYATQNYRDNNKLDLMNILGRMDYEFSQGSMFAEFGRIHEVQQLPGALLSAEVAQNRRQSFVDFANDYSDTETEVTRLGANIELTEQWFIEAELTSTDVEKDVQNSFRGWVVTTPSSVHSKQNEFTPRLIGIVPVNGGDMVLTAGMDVRETDYESGITNINDDQKVVSYYAQAVIPVVEKLSLTLGGRHSKVENDVVRYVAEEVNDRASVFEAGARFQYSSNLSLFARLDENFRFAKVDELTYASPGLPLDNQKGKSKELGVEWSGNGLSTKLFVYRLELEDEIAFDPTAAAPTGAPAYFGPGANVNLDSTVHDGFVVDGKYSISAAVDLIANFSYADATFASGSLEGNSISGVPERMFTLASNYRVSDSMKTYAEVIYTGDQYKSGDSANSQNKHGSYSVMNVSADYNWQEWTYSIRVNNLLDREYAESVNSYGAINPSPERNFWLSAAVKF